MHTGANSDRRRMDVFIPQSLFNRMQEIGGTTRSRGFFTDTIVAALEEHLPKLERPRIIATAGDNQDGTSWLDQLMEDTTRKKRK